MRICTTIGLAVVAAALLLSCSPPAAPLPQGPPQHIVSQLILADEVLWDLGPEVHARVAAVSVLADDPRYSGVAGSWPATVPRLGGSSEALVGVGADLAIVGSFTSQDVRALLRQAGVRTLVIDRLSGFADFREDVRDIAAAVGAESAGAALVARFDAGLERARRPRPEKPLRVVSWDQGIVPGAGTSFDDAAVAAGLVNAAAEAGLSGHSRVGVEQLLVWDVDVIAVPCAPGACEGAAAEIARLPGLGAGRAGRTGAIWAIPQGTMASAGFGMLTLVEALVARATP